MRKFYLYFPIYLDRMVELSWDSYVELMKLNNKKICYFYYNLAIFCKFEKEEIRNAIDSQIYYRI